MPMAGRMAYRHIDHIYVNVSIRTAAISVSTGLSVLFGLFQIFFFDNLLALDHGMPAVRALVLALHAACAAAGAAFIVHDLRAGDLFADFGAIVGITAKSHKAEDPSEEVDDEEDRRRNHAQKRP